MPQNRLSLGRGGTFSARLRLSGERRQPVTGEERETLLAARKRAADVLSASGAEAKRVASDAEAEAVALVFEQQNLAESLLSQEPKDSSEITGSKVDASDLLESHRN